MSSDLMLPSCVKRYFHQRYVIILLYSVKFCFDLNGMVYIIFVDDYCIVVGFSEKS